MTDSLAVPQSSAALSCDTVSAIRRAGGTLWKWMVSAGLGTKSQGTANCKTTLRFQSDSYKVMYLYICFVRMESLSPLSSDMIHSLALFPFKATCSLLINLTSVAIPYSRVRLPHSSLNNLCCVVIVVIVSCDCKIDNSFARANNM